MQTPVESPQQPGTETTSAEQSNQTNTPNPGSTLQGSNASPTSNAPTEQSNGLSPTATEQQPTPSQSQPSGGSNQLEQTTDQNENTLLPLAEHGDAGAQYHLGYIYANGLGVAQDYSKAVKWWQEAADRGLAEAQNNLGFMYEDGHGVPQDYSKALIWYRKAAEQGDAVAQFNVAVMYDDGRGVPQDNAEAVRWYRKAAVQALPAAQANLGISYANAQGVEQNYLVAYMWLSLAAASLNGDARTKAVNARDTIAAKLSPAEISQAQTMTRVCQQTNYKQCGELSSTQVVAASGSAVPMENDSGVYVVPVLINDALTIKFIIDSGSADVSIPADVVLTLMRTGTLSEADFLGTQLYTFADGTTTPSKTFRIKSLRVGNTILTNVAGSIADVRSVPLLGQSFLKQFKSWSIDNTQHALLLESPSGEPTAETTAPEPPVPESSPQPQSVPGPTQLAPGPTTNAVATAENSESSVCTIDSQPSFDCSKAISLAARTVCSSPELRQADCNLSHAFGIAAARAEAAGFTDAFRHEEGMWISQRDRACATRADFTNCLAEWIERRTQELIQRNAAATTGQNPGGH